MVFVFGDHELDVDQLEVRRAGHRVPLEPQAFDVLLYLVRHRERVVPKEELMDNVWGGRFVSEAAVTSRIKQVRRALGDDGTTQTQVRTYHGRGYRFVAEVADTRAPATPSRRPAHPPSARAATPVLGLPSPPGVQWQMTGQGPPDVLMLPAAQRLDAVGDDLTAALSARSRVIRLAVADPRRSDLLTTSRAVLDAAASARTLVLAEDSAWATALALALAEPDRVSGLVLFGVADADDGALATAQPEAVAVPVLVLHRTGDAQSPAAAGRLLASRLPHGEFRGLPGDAHEAAADAAQVCDAVADFVEDAAVAEAATQTLTALVGLAGNDLEALTSVLVELGGTLRRGPEDSVIVGFDGPASAFRALSSRRARGLADDTGIGVAIDEVTRSSQFVSGHGVDVARLFARHAAPGEVLVPNVIRDLLAGSGLSLEPLDPVDLPYVGPHAVHRWVPH